MSIIVSYMRIYYVRNHSNPHDILVRDSELQAVALLPGRVHSQFISDVYLTALRKNTACEFIERRNLLWYVSSNCYFIISIHSGYHLAHAGRIFVAKSRENEAKWRLI